MQVLGDVKQSHDEQVDEYKKYCDFLEPGSLKTKLESSIKTIEKATRDLNKPVEELRRKRDLLLAQRDRER